MTSEQNDRPRRSLVGRFSRWLFSWRTARRVLIALAVLSTLIALFYTEENWRGKRGWEKCKHDLEAKGEILDWSAYVPAPVPDEQNIIKAPKMAEWFVRDVRRGTTGGSSSNELTARLNKIASTVPSTQTTRRNAERAPIEVAELVVASPQDVRAAETNVIMHLDDPAEREKIRQLVKDAVGPSLHGAQGYFRFVLKSPDQIKRCRILLAADTRPSVAELSELLAANTTIPVDVGGLRVEGDVNSGSFRVLLDSKPTISAQEYLASSDSVLPEFSVIREALKRPYIRMDGDFQQPYEMPIINFVTIRTVVQTAAQRVQCCLLLGRSQQAFHELSFIFELRRLLAAKPTVLVSAMIDIAITGLYVDVIAQGFRLQAWREPELIALKEQLQQINLPPVAANSFRCERAAIFHTIEITTAQDRAGFWSPNYGNTSFWKRITNPTYLFFAIGPRGWLYRNMALVAPLEQIGIESYNPTIDVIRPSMSDKAVAEAKRMVSSHSPYSLLAAIAVPSYSKAMQTTARNQTKVNLALIACAVERYRLANGQYPETLDALVPQFADILPHDVIGGQPLHYWRTDDSPSQSSGAASGKYVLYSIGWNEKDDGGQIVRKKDGSVDTYSNEGDWVWSPSAN